MSVETLSTKIDIFLAMIQAGNGWYAMAVGLGVVFTSLILVSIVISVTGAFFRMRTERKLAGKAAPPALETGDQASAGDAEEMELAAAAVAVALALHESRMPGRGMQAGLEPDPGETWRLAGRALQHARGKGLR